MDGLAPARGERALRARGACDPGVGRGRRARARAAAARLEADGYSARELAQAAGGRLPNPGGLTAAALRDAAARDPAGAPAEILALCRLFQWLLPGLVVNVAFLREQLRAP